MSIQSPLSSVYTLYIILDVFLLFSSFVLSRINSAIHANVQAISLSKRDYVIYFIGFNNHSGEIGFTEFMSLLATSDVIKIVNSVQ